MKIGVAGCGAMGRPMAEAMRAAGFDLRGLDVLDPSGFGSLSEVMSLEPASFADREIVFSVVRDIPQTEALLFEDGGLLTVASALELLVISSTVSPAWVRALKDRLPSQVALVDAPMSGAPIAARERRLSFMLGGPESAKARLTPLLEAMGREIFDMGPLGAGMTGKVLNNLIAASSSAATRTALAWGSALGADETALLELFAASSGQTWFGSNYALIDWAREGYSTENTIGILEKDVRSLLDVAPEGHEPGFPEAVIAALRDLRSCS